MKKLRLSQGADQDFKWGEIYQMTKDQNVPGAGLEDMTLYENIIKSGITKVSMCPDLSHVLK